MVVVHVQLHRCCYQGDDDSLSQDLASDDDDVSDDAIDAAMTQRGASVTYTSQESSDAQFSMTSLNKSVSEESSMEDSLQQRPSPTLRQVVVDEEDGVTMETKTLSDCVTSDVTHASGAQEARVTSASGKQSNSAKNASAVKV